MLSACKPAAEEVLPVAGQLPATVQRDDQSDLAAEMKAAKLAARHPSDGAGRAWLTSGPRSVTVSQAARWQITFEAGELGIAEGGAVIFMVSPFWGWSPPQTTHASLSGFTTVSSDAAGVALTANPTGRSMMGIAIGGRRLEAGETIRIDYAGRADKFAESASRLWIGVDGDGDGRHRFLADSPAIEVEAATPNRLIALGPATARPGQPFEIRVSALDRRGNAGARFADAVALTSDPPGLQMPAELRLGENGSAGVRATARQPGVYRLHAKTASLKAVSNPIVVGAAPAQIYWADLHGHSGLSDGTGTPQDYFRYARDVANLDIVALTDHDHWGVLHLDENPRLWTAIEEHTRAFNQPGTFVTLLGYEWTSWISGHRHILYFEDSGPLYSSIDDEHDTPQEVWDALRGRPAITVAHHSAGGPIATDWTIAPDPELEPITEVVSIHGVSEAEDSPSVIYNRLPGNFVRDVLDRGYRLGFVGSGDSHDGHPGLAQLANGGTGGLAAIIAEELTRPALLEAIRRRRVYATSGPRIYLRCALGTAPMGSSVARGDLEEEAKLYVHAIGTSEIRWLDVIRSGTVARTEVGEAEIEALLPFTDPKPGEYIYIRIIQTDGGLAWSSPIFIE